MKSLIASLHIGDIVSFKEQLFNRLDQLADEKLGQLKVEMVDEMFEFDAEDLDEANTQKMGRLKLIKVRIRGGKIQRRKKVSAVKGFTVRGGKLTRMSSQERRRRKMAARKAKFKRRSKMRQSIMKRQRSLRRRKAMGV
jgi:secreted Zn-dependent insulinase-like peptidase